MRSPPTPQAPQSSLSRELGVVNLRLGSRLRPPFTALTSAAAAVVVGLSVLAASFCPPSAVVVDVDGLAAPSCGSGCSGAESSTNSTSSPQCSSCGPLV